MLSGNHSILARSKGDARRLADHLTTRGYHARHTKYRRHHVVLAVAPLDVVSAACRAVSFEEGRYV